MGYLENPIQKLETAKTLVKALEYEVILAEDASANGGAKLYHVGDWDSLVDAVYHTDMYKRWFYEMIFSTPVRRHGGHKQIEDDGGLCGVRFVMDIDYSLRKGDIEDRADRIASVLESASKIANKTTPPYVSSQYSENIRKEMRVIMQGLVCVESWEENVRRLRNIVRDWILECLSLLGFAPAEQEIHILDASNLESNGNEPEKLKFSLHLHLNGILLRQHAVDGAILARVLNAVMAGNVLQSFSKDASQDASFWSRCILLQIKDIPPFTGKSISREAIAGLGIIDESIYSGSRAFRLWLSTKSTQDRPLTRVDDDGCTSEKRNVSLAGFRRGMADFRISFSRRMHCPSGEPIDGNQFEYQESFPELKRSCAKRLDWRRGRGTESPDVTKVRWNERKLREEPLKIIWNTFKSDNARDGTVSDSRPKKDSRVSSSTKKSSGRVNFKIIDSTTTIYTDTGTPVQAGSLIENAIYHCPTCDCHPRGEEVPRGSESGAPDHNPSANCFITAERNLALWCFGGCETVFLVQQILNYHGFDGSTRNTTEVTPTPDGYFPSEIVAPILERCLSQKGNPSLIAINAGMGSGKTYAANELSRKAGVGRVIVFTHRRSLAKALAVTFDAMCYRDVRKDQDMGKFDRLVIVVNSLYRLKECVKCYDLVIIDEAGFVRRHLTGQTFSTTSDPNDPRSVRNTLPILSLYCSRAKCVLLLQEGLSDDDVQFYNALRKNCRRVRKFYMPTSPQLEKYKLIETKKDWLNELYHTITVCEKKTFVACSRADEALHLYIFFRDYCPNLRVALIRGDSVEPPEVDNAEAFVQNYRDYDVCIATSAMETGVSLTGHYTEVFALYRSGPISHWSQAQLVNRVRNAKRIVIFASKGTPFSQRQTISQLERDWTNSGIVKSAQTPPAPHAWPGWLDDVMCSAHLATVLENADTQNFNNELWTRHREATILKEFYHDKQKVQDMSKNYGTLVSRNCQALKELAASLNPDYCDSDHKNNIAPTANTAEENDGDKSKSESETDFNPDNALQRDSLNRHLKATEFMDTDALSVMRAFMRRSQFGTRLQNQNSEVEFHRKASKYDSFARRVFILLALVDYLAALANCTDDTQRENIKKYSYWSEIERWCCTQKPTINSKTQAHLQSFLEVLQCCEVTQAMYPTFFPAKGMYMVKSPENTTAVATTLKQWKRPSGVVACSEHTLTSVRNASTTDIKNANAAARNHESSAAKLGSGTQAFVQTRIPISWKSAKREKKHVNLIRPWSAATFGLVACGMLNAHLPGDDDALIRCSWFFFTVLETLSKALRKYRQPEDGATFEVESKALEEIDVLMDTFRKKLEEAGLMKLQLLRETFDLLDREISAAASTR